MNAARSPRPSKRQPLSGRACQPSARVLRQGSGQMRSIKR
jgi:hypothetical protein